MAFKTPDELLADLTGNSERTHFIFPKLDDLGLLEKAMNIALQEKDNDKVHMRIASELKFNEEMNNDTIDALRNANIRPNKTKVHKTATSLANDMMKEDK